jgi:predicted metal-dependent hydrolase
MDYSIRRSDRARRVRVTVESDGTVVVVMPRRAPERSAAAAVQELSPWIERRLSEVHAQRAVIDSRNGTVPYLGATLTLVPQASARRVSARSTTLKVPADPVTQRHALELWYRRQAAREVASRLDGACAEAGLSYTKLTIRAQRTRWASCSRSGAMSFNWRLLMAPPEILDYVVWHEVCHLAHMDHSPRFWGLLAQYRPDYETQRRWLSRHGATLTL